MNRSPIFSYLKLFFPAFLFFFVFFFVLLVIVKQCEFQDLQGFKKPFFYIIIIIVVVHNTYQHMPFLVAIVDSTVHHVVHYTNIGTCHILLFC